MVAGELIWRGLDLVARELALFAAAGILVGGIGDLCVDLLWIARAGWKRLFIYSRHRRATAAGFPAADRPGRIAVFVPAWHESEVIGAMLRTACDHWAGADIRLYVGLYPNDPDTIAAVAAVGDPRVRAAINPRPGPTTKGDNLNAMWAALLADEAAQGWQAKAIVLHDAEDVVHPAEIRIYDRLIERFDLVQLPVVALVDPATPLFGRMIGAHYADEFAEAHGRTLVVREAIGAAVPSAGVGCAFSRARLAAVADVRGGQPFDADSLTEDYELGLRIGEAGGRGVFVRVDDGVGGIVSVRAHFPVSLSAAVRQKARWMTGIALNGWDRLGWRGSPAERWMRFRDRQAVLAAVVLVAAYGALACWGVLALAELAGGYRPLVLEPWERALLIVNVGLLAWRLAMRALFVGRTHGWRQGLASVPRVIVANIVAMMAARRALAHYLHILRGGRAIWEKTTHIFPADVKAAR
ncbi:adsorption protein B [Sphingomonas jejuensis]|uniref:Adsorption protein B n=1 Tax=Sphingomonas jejuensis TaxID=904715 RepID=A0ABX0XNZ0_9SPHN|nr:glycosyl transferase family protein [Sphingomonas jejuensis]NJC35103.1 adsorption protein B [Sphingomonas jejuensis]